MEEGYHLVSLFLINCVFESNVTVATLGSALHFLRFELVSKGNLPVILKGINITNNSVITNTNPQQAHEEGGGIRLFSKKM